MSAPWQDGPAVRKWMAESDPYVSYALGVRGIRPELGEAEDVPCELCDGAGFVQVNCGGQAADETCWECFGRGFVVWTQRGRE